MRSKKGNFTRDLQGFAVLTLALLIGGFMLLRNNQPIIGDAAGDPAPALLTPTSRNLSWQQVVQQQLLSDATPVPTVYVPRPTLEPPVTAITTAPNATGPVVWQSTPTPTRYVPENRPTRAAPTAESGPVEPVVRRQNDPRKGQFSPPPEQVPLSLDPRDHFWFRRPVDSSANSSGIFWYVYGSDGPRNEWRVHHGIDLPNPIGKEVRAAGPGIVIWAGNNYVWYEDGKRVESAYTYGNVVIILHDFGYQGQRLYTLYAHMARIFVQAEQRVETGSILGLSGNTGVVSGPHVHFEVRVGQNNYYETRNPILWMAPYENHGVIAGRLLFPNGQPVEDVTIGLFRNGRLIDSTTTYVKPRLPGMRCNRCWHVNPDEVWRENFVIGDVPVGEYELVATVNGVKYSRRVTVRPATTSFVDLNAPEFIGEPTPAG